MNIREVIDYKINLLIEIMLTDGVSPSDLANNIFSDEYTDISFHKDGECIIGELSFMKKERNDFIKMKYSYNLNMRVQRIDEYTNAKWVCLWDRNMREQEIVIEIIELMKSSHTKSQIIDFISSLPLEIKSKFIDECVKIA